MIDFPSTTVVNQTMPKEAFYRNLDLNTKQKDLFVSDIQKIVMANKLSKDTLNVAENSEIQEIDVLHFDLKKQDFSKSILEIIARKIPRKLVFILKFEDKIQLALYHQKLYQTEWMREDEAELRISSNNLDEIWKYFIEQIALTVSFDVQSEKSIDEKLADQATIQKLKKEIDKLERMGRKEIQPKKKYEIYKKQRKLISELQAFERDNQSDYDLNSIIL